MTSSDRYSPNCGEIIGRTFGERKPETICGSLCVFIERMLVIIRRRGEIERVMGVIWNISLIQIYNYQHLSKDVGGSNTKENASKLQIMLIIHRKKIRKYGENEEEMLRNAFKKRSRNMYSKIINKVWDLCFFAWRIFREDREKNRKAVCISLEFCQCRTTDDRREGEVNSLEYFMRASTSEMALLTWQRRIKFY